MLDIEKAYDHINWNFLLLILKKISFREKWNNWIKWYISIIRYSILVNGTPSSIFQNSQRFRQGHPISHYLFVIAK